MSPPSTCLRYNKRYVQYLSQYFSHCCRGCLNELLIPVSFCGLTILNIADRHALLSLLDMEHIVPNSQFSLLAAMKSSDQPSYKGINIGCPYGHFEALCPLLISFISACDCCDGAIARNCIPYRRCVANGRNRTPLRNVDSLTSYRSSRNAWTKNSGSKLSHISEMTQKSHHLTDAWPQTSAHVVHSIEPQRRCLPSRSASCCFN